MRTPAAGSRSAMTSQNARRVLTPTPSGVGQVVSGATFFGGVAGAGLRAGGGFRVCADTGAATSNAIAIRRRMDRVYQTSVDSWLMAHGLDSHQPSAISHDVIISGSGCAPLSSSRGRNRRRDAT